MSEVFEKIKFDWVYHASKAFERLAAAMWLLRHGNLAEALDRLGAAITSITVAIDRCKCAKSRELLRTARDVMSSVYSDLQKFVYMKALSEDIDQPEYLERYANDLKIMYERLKGAQVNIVAALRSQCGAAKSLEEFLREKERLDLEEKRKTLEDLLKRLGA